MGLAGSRQGLCKGMAAGKNMALRGTLWYGWSLQLCLGITGGETREIRIKVVMGVKYFLQLKAMVSDLKIFGRKITC